MPPTDLTSGPAPGPAPATPTASIDTARLSFRGVSKTYGKDPTAVHALVDVSFAIEPGEFVAVMGPSGSGKSTLLSMAGGLETPTEGGIHLDGTDLAKLSRSKLAQLRLGRVGYIFQEFNLLPALTAIENTAMPLQLAGRRRADAVAVAGEHLRQIGLGDRLDHYPDDLSGGERQRVAIARALTGGSRLVLADEPTGALDTVNGENVMRSLRQSCDAGAAVVVVTHNPGLASWADRVVFIRDGRLIDTTDMTMAMS